MKKSLLLLGSRRGGLLAIIFFAAIGSAIGQDKGGPKANLPVPANIVPLGMTDFAVTAESESNSILHVGDSAMMVIGVQNLLTSAGSDNFTLNIPKPSNPSGLQLIIGSSSAWTVATTVGQYVVTSTTPVPLNGLVTIPVKIKRVGGAAGNFYLTGTIMNADDVNSSNNASGVVYSKTN
jgi:hypothetical protein